MAASKQEIIISQAIGQLDK